MFRHRRRPSYSSVARSLGRSRRSVISLIVRSLVREGYLYRWCWPTCGVVYRSEIVSRCRVVDVFVVRALWLVIVEVADVGNALRMMTGVRSVGFGMTKASLNARNKCVCRAIHRHKRICYWATFCRNASDTFDNRVIPSSPTPQEEYAMEAAAESTSITGSLSRLFSKTLAQGPSSVGVQMLPSGGC